MLDLTVACIAPPAQTDAGGADDHGDSHPFADAALSQPEDAVISAAITAGIKPKNSPATLSKIERVSKITPSVSVHGLSITAMPMMPMKQAGDDLYPACIGLRF